MACVVLRLVITPTDAPTATVPDLASPLAVALCSPRLLACSATLPLALIALPAAIEAVVFWFSVVVATAASNATFPPSAPAVASVSLSDSEVAESVRSRAPRTCAFCPIWATASAPITFSATETPTPTLPPLAPPASVGVALAT